MDYPHETRRKPTVELRRAKAVALVASGVSNAETARRMGVSRQTVSEWMNAPDGHVRVQQTADEIARSVVSSVSATLAAAAIEAVDALVDMMRRAPNTSDRIRAAIYLCDRGFGKSTGISQAHQGAVGGATAAFERLPTRELARRLLETMELSDDDDGPF